MCKHKLNKRSRLKQRLRQKRKIKVFKAYVKAKAPRLDFLSFLSVKFITIQRNSD